jgi:hypothetical protein
VLGFIRDIPRLQKLLVAKLTQFFKAYRKGVLTLLHRLWQSIVAFLQDILVNLKTTFDLLVKVLKEVQKIAAKLQPAVAAIQMVIRDIAVYVGQLAMASPLLAVVKKVQTTLRKMIDQIAQVQARMQKEAVQIIRNAGA